MEPISLTKIQKKLFVFVLLFWTLILGGFVGMKEYTLRAGTEVILKALPVDPRDLFRGDYVVLHYDISDIELPTSMNRLAEKYEINDRLYINLKAQGSIWVLNTFSKKTISFKDTVTIKGTIKKIQNDIATVEYGIESWFVPEHQGYRIERFVNSDRITAKILVDKFGNAVTKELLLDNQAIDNAYLESEYEKMMNSPIGPERRPFEPIIIEESTN